jgi:hypothetical protein
MGEASESWINEHINQRKGDGQAICIQVFLDEDGVNMILSTPACGSGGGGGRRPTAREQEIFDLWNKHHLNETQFTGGNVIAFLKQLRRLL